MVKQQSNSSAEKIRQLSSIVNDWHKCERFELRGAQCPYKTAGFEEDDDDPEEKPKLIIPARKRVAQQAEFEIGDQERVLDIPRVIKEMPQPRPEPQPAPIPIPLPAIPPAKEPIPGRPVDNPEPIAALEHLPDGIPILNPGTQPFADIGALIEWAAQHFTRQMATKPAISLQGQLQPSTLNSPMPLGALEAISAGDSARKAASAEETFAQEFASSMIPVGNIEREVNTSSSKTKVNKRQIATAAAAAAAVGTALKMRGGGGRSGGGQQFKSIFNPLEPQLVR